MGLFAAFGAWLARRLWKALPRLTLHVPGPLIEAPFAMSCAFGYGLLAGMGLPTVRTLLMIAVALLARYARRATSVPQALGLAALGIMLWDPLAVLAPGFWLSFVGVAILLSATSPVGDERPPWRDMPRVQLLLSLALLPMTVWFFGQASLIGPLANLLAVPWISFVVVPVTVVASLLVAWAPSIGTPLLHVADTLLMPLWHAMQWMAALPSAQRYFVTAPAWTFALALVGIAWSLAPRGLPLRAFGVLLALPMLGRRGRRWPAASSRSGCSTSDRACRCSCARVTTHCCTTPVRATRVDSTWVTRSSFRPCVRSGSTRSTASWSAMATTTMPAGHARSVLRFRTR